MYQQMLLEQAFRATYGGVDMFVIWWKGLKAVISMARVLHFRRNIIFLAFLVSIDVRRYLSNLPQPQWSNQNSSSLHDAAAPQSLV